MTKQAEELSHVAADGSAAMVDVSDKAVTKRIARASGTISMAVTTLEAIKANQIKKGDVLTTAKIAGVMAAKRTHDLIPLCHPLPLTDIQVDFEENATGYTAKAAVKTTGKTGVEMEALAACSVALLTVYDMAKAIDRHMVISDVKVIAKAGGASGDWSLDTEAL
ncbi:MAG: cyclic pyranopterin monophosphate synthase MoaC [Pseudomonadota bacterium]